MAKEAACAYVRVSTYQQAQHDLSIPDQLNQIRAFAEKRGFEIVVEFVEPGASARSDERPVFQEMIARAMMKPPEFKHVLVHSQSRFFRDAMYFEWYRRKLEANGVQLTSITQDFGEGETGVFTRQVMALIDEMNSKETAKHVRRTMIENARQNFWNGSTAPLGFKTVVADVRGAKQKKKLEIEPEGAELVRLIFNLCTEGDGQHGPMGLKNISKYLNARGYFTPKGNKFHTSYVHKVLVDEVYIGRAWWNKVNSKDRSARPKEEWVAIQVPAIVAEEQFRRAGALLASRRPSTTAPRLVNSPVLLTGVARCGACGGLMHRQTGKGGKYVFYRCSNRIRRGTCPAGPEIGMSGPVLDKIVMDHLLDQLLTPDRVQAIVAEVASRRANGTGQTMASISQFEAQLKRARTKLRNLMNALAEGVVDSSEAFKTTVNAVENECERLTAQIAAHQRKLESQIRPLSKDEASELAQKLRQRLLASEPSLKKRIIRSFVGQVILTKDEIMISGAKSDLAEAVTGTPGGEVPRSGQPVPTFDRGWWRTQS